jgi:hypothetical protein
MTLASSISDATIWSVPYYDRKTFIVQATGVQPDQLVNKAEEAT